MPNKDLGIIGQEATTERGQQGTPVVERTSPKRSTVDTIKVKEIKKMIDKASAGGIEFTPEQKEQILNLLEVLLNNTDTNTLEVGGNLEVDGDYKSDSEDLYIYRGVNEEGAPDASKTVISKNPPDYDCSCIYIDSDGAVRLGYWLEDVGDFDCDRSIAFDIYEGIIGIAGTSKLTDFEGNLILKDLEDAVNGENTIEITITDDDWDDDLNGYAKRIELNNTYIKFNFQGTYTYSVLRIYNPYFKAMNDGVNENYVYGILTSTEASERFIEVTETFMKNSQTMLTIFNGFVNIGLLEL